MNAKRKPAPAQGLAPRPATLDVPQIRDTVRPFRLWDAIANHNVPHRCYATERRALDSALLLIRWGRVGDVIDVYDARTARFLGAYALRVNAIEFTR